MRLHIEIIPLDFQKFVRKKMLIVRIEKYYLSMQNVITHHIRRLLLDLVQSIRISFQTFKNSLLKRIRSERKEKEDKYKRTKSLEIIFKFFNSNWTTSVNRIGTDNSIENMPEMYMRGCFWM